MYPKHRLYSRQHVFPVLGECFHYVANIYRAVSLHHGISPLAGAHTYAEWHHLPRRWNFSKFLVGKNGDVIGRCVFLPSKFCPWLPSTPASTAAGSLSRGNNTDDGVEEESSHPAYCPCGFIAITLFVGVCAIAIILDVTRVFESFYI